MPKVDITARAPDKVGSDYPAPFDREPGGRVIRSVSAAGGATDWNANHVTVPPGGWSSQRHWHAGEDEIVVILAGEGMLIDDTGRTAMRAGEIAVFPKNDGNGHHFVNDSDAPLVILALGLPEASRVTYSDIDLIADPDRGELHRDGTRYQAVAGCSNFSITHSSSCAEAIQSCMKGWLSTAST